MRVTRGARAFALTTKSTLFLLHANPFSFGGRHYHPETYNRLAGSNTHPDVRSKTISSRHANESTITQEA